MCYSRHRIGGNVSSANNPEIVCNGQPARHSSRLVVAQNVNTSRSMSRPAHVCSWELTLPYSLPRSFLVGISDLCAYEFAALRYRTCQNWCDVQIPCRYPRDVNATAFADLHTPSIVMRFCKGHSLSHRHDTFPLHYGPRLEEQTDRLTLRMVEGMVLRGDKNKARFLRQHVWASWGWHLTTGGDSCLSQYDFYSATP